MIKKAPFSLLFLSIFIISACTTTQPKIENTFINTADNLSLTTPNLTGTWVLNRELSQNPLEQNRKKPNNTQSNKAMKGNGEHKGSGKGKGKNRSNNYSKNKRKAGRNSLPPSLQFFLNASEKLTLKHVEPFLIIDTAEGQEKVYTDFRSSTISTNNDPDQRITIAGWEDNILFLESTLSAGRVIQQFNLKTASDQLWVKTAILTPHLPKSVRFNRVYDRVDTSAQ